MGKKIRKSYLFTGNKDLCSGCRACEKACSVHAIEMQEDDEGFLYPFIDSNKCVDCGLCDRICPMNPENEVKDSHYKQCCFGVWPRMKGYKLSQSCATVGFSTMISEYVLQKAGIVYGVMLNHATNSAEHIRITTLANQPLMRNSKYIQSDTGQTFELVKKDLQNGKLVYYTGTPCQIAGLKAFLRKDYDNLLTTDLICHGVCSSKMYGEELKFWQKRYKSEVTDFRFRGKGIFPYIVGGLVNFNIRKNGIKRHVNVMATYSPLYYSFAYSDDGYNYNLRLSCYNCRFRNMNRTGDITIGDFHGAAKYHKITFPMYQFGLSLVLVNSAKGEDIFDNLKKMVHCFETERNKAAVQPALCGGERDVPIQRQQIYDNLGKMPYDELVRRFIFPDKHLNTRLKGTFKYLFKYYIVAMCRILHIK